MYRFDYSLVGDDDFMITIYNNSIEDNSLLAPFYTSNDNTLTTMLIDDSIVINIKKYLESTFGLENIIIN